jgi:hypothetical protein
VKISYAEVLATARVKIPLSEVGMKSARMRKTMIGAIVLEVSGEKERE